MSLLRHMRWNVTFSIRYFLFHIFVLFACMVTILIFISYYFDDKKIYIPAAAGLGSSTAPMRMRQRDEHRLQLAQHLVSRLRLQRKLPWHFDPAKYRKLTDEVSEQSAKIDVQILIVTVNRNAHQVDKYEPRYLTQSLAAFMQLVEMELEDHLSKYSRVNLTVCNIDPNPQYYSEFQQLAAIVDTITPRRALLNSTNPDQRDKRGVNEQKFDDFMLCLLEFQRRYRNKFLLVLHDDILPIETRFFQVFRSLILDLIPSSIDESGQHFGFVKLHHPKDQISFLSLPFFDLLRVAVALGLLSAMSVLFYIRVVERNINCKRCKSESDSVFSRRLTSNSNQSRTLQIQRQHFVIFTVFLFAFMLSAVAWLGAPTVFRFRRFYAPFDSDHLLVSDASMVSCCHRALLLTEQSVREFIDFASRSLRLSNSHSHSNMKAQRSAASHDLDSLLSAFASIGKFRSFTLLPNVMQHIGLYPAYSNRLHSIESLDY